MKADTLAFMWLCQGMRSRQWWKRKEAGNHEVLDHVILQEATSLISHLTPEHYTVVWETQTS
jgi:hypothetical protein